MSVFSKLFKKNPLSRDSDAPKPADAAIDIAVVEAEQPQPAPGLAASVPISTTIPTPPRPPPLDVHNRTTLLHLDPVVAEERPTVVAPEPLTATLAKVSATTAPPVARTGSRAMPPRAPSSPTRPASSQARPASSQARPASSPTRPASSPPRPMSSAARPASSPPRPMSKPPGPASKPPGPASKPPGPASKPPRPLSKSPLPPPAVQRPEVVRPQDDELDARFDALESGTAHVAGPGTLDTDLGDVHTLFGQIATNHMRQVRDFIIELRWGSTPKTWLAVCESSVESLRRAAEMLEFPALASGLGDLASAMQASAVTPAATIEGTERDRILSAHAELEAILPDTFALDGDRSLREATILHALLSQVPDVGKVTIDKLYAAGLTTLETMLLATAEDIVATTAISEVVAEHIVARFRRYRAEMASAAIDDTRTQERAKIASLVEELRRQNDAFERASAAWTKDAIQQKKDILLARGQTALEIDLQLARLGEIALVRELERLPFARKLVALDAFLAAADTKYAAGI
jgi:hypothetical protein